MRFLQRLLYGRLKPFFTIALLAGCGGAVEDADPGAAEFASEATAQTGQAISVCGIPPRPPPCNQIVCNSAEQTWEYIPFAEGALCKGTGRCDDSGNCIMPPPPPPADHTVNVSIDDTVRTLVRVLVSGTFVSIDTSGAAPELVTGSHQECTDPPGPNPLLCWTVRESTNAYVKFSDSLKSLYQLRTNKTLTDLAFPRMGAVCGGPTFLETCGYVNQIRADLGDVELALAGSGTRP
ncbi:MAG TPA: hypothetical protein VK524_07410, partial [Polyangiaceae bacterium]|nr:hypothetical protein [Polyangiaceae bacterium]